MLCNTLGISENVLCVAVAQALGHTVYNRRDFIKQRFEFLKQHGNHGSQSNFDFVYHNSDDDIITAELDNGKTKFLDNYLENYHLLWKIATEYKIGVEYHSQVYAASNWHRGDIDDVVMYRSAGSTPAEAVLRCFLLMTQGKQVDIPDPVWQRLQGV